MFKKIVSFSSIKYRIDWLNRLGGVSAPAVKNQEWLSLLINDGRNTLSIEGEFDNRWNLEEILTNPNYKNNSTRKILNFFDAAMLAYELAFMNFKENKFKIPKSLILHLHTKIFRNIPRSFSQKIGTWALSEREIKKSKLKTISPQKIEKCIQKISWFVKNLKAEPTRKAAIFHAFFEHIHPFPDGNGRIGRVLLNFILISHGLPPIAIKGLKKNDREKYYSALEKCDLEIFKILNNQKTFQEINFQVFFDLENLLEKPLTIALDTIICRRFEKQKPLLKLSEVAKILNKNFKSLSVAAAQKKYISIVQNGVAWSHPDFFN